MTNIAIETFITRLRDRPWIDPALVDVIAGALLSPAAPVQAASTAARLKGNG
jgi:hypothetical protein